MYSSNSIHREYDIIFISRENFANQFCWETGNEILLVVKDTVYNLCERIFKLQNLMFNEFIEAAFISALVSSTSVRSRKMRVADKYMLFTNSVSHEHGYT